MRFKHILCLLLSVLAALSLFAACDKPEPEPICTVNGTPIENYRIVYQPDGMDFTKLAALDLRTAIKNLTGFELEVVTHDEAETEYEILIGDTNRTQSINLYREFLAPMEYAYTADGSKIVINSEIYLLSKAVGTFAEALGTTPAPVTVPETAVSAVFEFLPAKSAILLIGDGCGENHSAYALENGLPVYLPRLLPNQGYATTKSANSAITDSAAAGTALATGYKTDNSVIGQLPSGKILKNLSELAIHLGKDALVLSNDPITGATPAAFSAHADDRSNEEKIAADQANFRGLMIAGSNLMGSVEESNAFFYSAIEAINTSNNENGFFMMYEESYTDYGGHSNDFSIIYPAVERFNQVTYLALEYVLEHPDTVLIITADHETGGVNKSPQGWGFSSTSHTAANVPVHAIGYGTEVFNGKVCDNTDISKFIAYTLGATEWGDSRIPYAFK